VRTSRSRRFWLKVNVRLRVSVIVSVTETMLAAVAVLMVGCRRLSWST
jgi:hypothetical protein